MQEFEQASLEQLPSLFQRLESLFLLDIQFGANASTALLARCKQLPVPAAAWAKMYLIHSKMLWGKGEYHAAFYSITQSLKRIRESSLFELKAEAYLVRGQCNLNLKRHLVAIEDFTYSVELALEYSQLSIAIESYVNISQIYYFAGQHEAARELLIIGYRLSVLLNDHKQIAKSGIYLANNLIDSNAHADAQYVLYQIEPSILQYGDMTWLVESGKNMAVCYAAQSQNELAELYFGTMLAIARFNNALWGYALISLYYAEFLLDQKRVHEAIDYINQAEEGINSFDYGYLQQKSAILLMRAYKCIGNYEAALQQIKRYEAYSVDLLSNDVLSNLSGKGINLMRLDRSRKKIVKTRQDFEHMLDLVSPSESLSRKDQFFIKCSNLPENSLVIHLHFIDIPFAKAQFLQKINALLREFCLLGLIWSKVSTSEFLVISDSECEVKEAEIQALLAMIDGFPWAWHGLESPKATASIISAKSAIQLLLKINEGANQIELLV